MPDQFITPPDHVNFLAKPLFGAEGAIRDGAIACLAPQGGGPTTPHTHAHDHLFIVVKGEAKILLDDDVVFVGANETFRVKGTVPHSIWNNLDSETVMIGISIQ